MSTILTTALMGFFVWSGVGQTGPVTTPAIIEIPEGPSYNVWMTAYNAVPEQTDSDPFTTASGAFSNPEVVAARSVDLAGTLPFGTVIAVTRVGASTSCGYPVASEFIGFRVIADSMHPRKRNQIDILLDHGIQVQVGEKTMNPAVAMGICKDVEIRVIGKIDVKNIPATQAELKTIIGKSQLAVNQ
jgi:3D (Asp-Asp-Asp) domain-containing protein